MYFCKAAPVGQGRVPILCLACGCNCLRCTFNDLAVRLSTLNTVYFSGLVSDSIDRSLLLPVLVLLSRPDSALLSLASRSAGVTSLLTAALAGSSFTAPCKQFTKRRGIMTGVANPRQQRQERLMFRAFGKPTCRCPEYRWNFEIGFLGSRQHTTCRCAALVRHPSRKPDLCLT